MRRVATIVCLLTLFALAISASAQLIDPSTLHVGTGAGTPCATGCGNDPNIITSTNWSLYQNSGGAEDIGSPFYLLVAAPVWRNGGGSYVFAGGSAPSVNSTAAYYNPYPGSSSNISISLHSFGGTSGGFAPEVLRAAVYFDASGN